MAEKKPHEKPKDLTKIKCVTNIDFGILSICPKTGKYPDPVYRPASEQPVLSGGEDKLEPVNFKPGEIIEVSKLQAKNLVHTGGAVYAGRAAQRDANKKIEAEKKEAVPVIEKKYHRESGG